MDRSTHARHQGVPAARTVAQRTRRLVLAAAGLVFLLAGWSACSDDNPAAPEYALQVPSQWADAVDNPYFPLVPGTRWEYTGNTDEGTETTIVEVLAEKRLVNGVQATVVRDQVSLDGEVTEDTSDWFAQDAAGNVWYLGEESKEMENGRVVSTEGSWEWGVDGALPGIIMWADPAAHVGEEYQQEYYVGEAEDWGRVVALGDSVRVPFGRFTDCIRTEDWNALEKGSRESKYYCRQIGVALELEGRDERVELVTMATP
ncbi:MAG: hypothetical protein AB1505_04010 [Candidatus Latescibacterota bacterium]